MAFQRGDDSTDGLVGAMLIAEGIDYLRMMAGVAPPSGGRPRARGRRR